MDKYRRIQKIKNNFKRTEMLEGIADCITLIIFFVALYWSSWNVKF